MTPETGRNPNESTATPAGSEAVLTILVAASFSHLLNDTLQSLIPAIYPVLKDSFQLNFTQIGLITLTFQVTASFRLKCCNVIKRVRTVDRYRAGLYVPASLILGKTRGVADSPVTA